MAEIDSAPSHGRGGGGEVRAALAATAARLGFSATPRLDAELLMAHALGVERNAILLDPDRYAVPDAFAAITPPRVAGSSGGSNPSS